MKKIMVFIGATILMLSMMACDNQSEVSEETDDTASIEEQSIVPEDIEDIEDIEDTSSPDVEPNLPTADEETVDSEEIPETSEETPLIIEDVNKDIDKLVIPTQELAWWQEGLAVDKIVDNNSDQSCTNWWSSFIFYDEDLSISHNMYGIFDEDEMENKDNVYGLDLLDSAEESDDIGARILGNDFFEIVVLDDTKYTIYFHQNGVQMVQSLPGMDKNLSVKLALDADDYALILSNIESELIYFKELRGGDIGRAQWLSMMKKSRITNITVTSSDGEVTKDLGSYGDMDDIEKGIVDAVNTQVYNAKITEKRSLDDSAKTVITFNNGLVFEVYTGEDNLLIYANDIDTALIYDLQSDYDQEEMDSYANDTVVPATGKPVIYLYPESKMDCTVKVDYPKFTYTYPDYNSGWDVTAYPDGKIINKSDNSEHYYLFWEGNEKIDWKFDSGFCVKGSDTQDFLLEKLKYMGLTPREYNDFITYWVPRLQDNPYNLITFSEEQYEELAPLRVTPTPDTVLRVHMVYKGLDEPVEIPEQILEPTQRDGFTVVEWGGTKA